MNAPQGQTSFNVSINTTGIPAMSGLPFTLLPMGGYEVIIEASSVVGRKSGVGSNLVVEMLLQDGDVRGTKRTSWLMIPAEGDKRPDLSIARIRALLHSVGLTEQQTEGNVNISEAVLNGKTAYIFVNHKEEEQEGGDTRTQEDIRFLTREQYLKNKASDLAARTLNAPAAAPKNGASASRGAVAVSGPSTAPASTGGKDLASIIGAQPRN